MNDKIRSILPVSASRAERVVDSTAGDMLAEIAVCLIRYVKNPDLCPTELLPWLAWEMAVDTWSEHWTEAEKRAAIKRAAYIHRHRGTKAALMASLADSPFRSQIVEWYEQSPHGEPYTFRLNVEQKDLPVLMNDHQDLKHAVLRAKNLRSWFSVHIYGRHSGEVYGAGYIASTEILKNRLYVRRILPAESDVMLLPGEQKVIPVTLLPEGADDKSFTATVTSDTVVTTTVREGALYLHGLRRGQSSVILTTVNGVTATVTVRVVAEARFMVRVDDASKPLFFAHAGGFTIDYGDGVDSRDYTLQDGGVYTTREVAAGTVMILTVKGCDSLCFYRSGRERSAPLLELFRISSDRSSMYQFAWWQAELNKIHPGALDDLPDVTTYAHAFSHCASLSALPDALFSGSPAVTSFAHVFYGCTSLQGVPADLFRRNHQVTTMTHAFRDCTALKSVPAGLFDSAVQVTTFSNLFYGCSSLRRLPEGLFRAAVSATDFSALCYGCQSLTALPAGLFTGAVNATMFTSAFAYCNQLTALPDDLFRGLTKASVFFQSFLHCRSLTALPSCLFADCLSAVSFNATFSHCTGLVTLPEDIFALKGGDSLITFADIFSYCTALTTVPATLFNPVKARITNAGYAFRSSGLIRVPARLFANAVNCLSFRTVFQSCSELRETGDEVFAGSVAATTAQECFEFCRKLTAVGERLFADCEKMATFTATFRICGSLQAVPGNLFEGCRAAASFRETFNGCGFTGVPEELFMSCTDADAVVMEATFSGCSALTTVPAGLFSPVRSRISSAMQTFSHCTSLTAVPSRLLAGATNCRSVSGIFASCRTLKTVGDEVFSGCTRLASSDGVFSDCSALTTAGSRLMAGCAAMKYVSALFESCIALESVGGELLSGCTALERTYRLFKNCYVLVTVPADTFRGCQAMTFSSELFEGCRSLTGIPDTLFADSPLLHSAEKMFYGCTSLTRVPPDIVKPGNEGGSLNWMFRDCSSLSVDINTLFTQTFPEGYLLAYLFYGCTNVTGSKSAFLENFPSPVTVSGCFNNCPLLK